MLLLLILSACDAGNGYSDEIRGVDARLFECLPDALRAGGCSGMALIVINNSSLAKVACVG